MKTDKELLKDFKVNFHPQKILTENEVLVLMGMARAEERKVGNRTHKKKAENSNIYSDLEKHGYSFEKGT